MNLLEWIFPAEPTAMEKLAVAAMEMKLRHQRARFVVGHQLQVHTRDLRAPVNCVACLTVYEANVGVCPSCTSEHAIGPVTELSLQIRELRAS